MATTTKKTKAKRKTRARAKPKSPAASLLAETATVLKSKSSGKTTRTSEAGVASLNPALAMFGFMSRVTAAYAELPARLAACRSPMDFWREQARFAQRILNESQPTATTSSPALEIKRTRARH